MARSKRVKSATESLLGIAIILDIGVVFFGALALNGLGFYAPWVIALGAFLAVVVFVALYRVLRFRAGQWAGHLIHLAMLAGCKLSLLPFRFNAAGWSAVGRIWRDSAVAVGFWVFGAIRGPALDRGSSPAAD